MDQVFFKHVFIYTIHTETELIVHSLHYQRLEFVAFLKQYIGFFSLLKATQLLIHF